MIQFDIEVHIQYNGTTIKLCYDAIRKNEEEILSER